MIGHLGFFLLTLALLLFLLSFLPCLLPNDSRSRSKSKSRRRNALSDKNLDRLSIVGHHRSSTGAWRHGSLLLMATPFPVLPENTGLRVGPPLL
jgi:hypothetical protein